MNSPSWIELTVNGLWIDFGISEDCQLCVGWKYEPHFYSTGESKPKVLQIENCFGVSTGTDYISRIRMTGDLLDHLSDMILELQEM